MHRVVIVGGGFGGLNAARKLRRAPVEITLFDRRNFHLFQPLLYQVATGGLSPADISSPLRAVLKKQENARVIQDEVVDLDPGGRRVTTRHGETAYDTLILATGSGHDYHDHDAWARHAPGLKTIEEATGIRARILGAFEEAERTTEAGQRNVLLTFVIVGGGPTGVELAGAIGELARHTLKRDFRSFDPASARILLVERAPRILPGYPETLSAAAQRCLEGLGVEVLASTGVRELDGDGVTLRREGWTERVHASTLLWAAGVSASPLARLVARRAGIDTDAAGRVPVGSDCALAGHPEIFVIGDMARHEGPGGEPLPGVAPVAIQQGSYVARRIRNRLAGKESPAFRYRDRGTLAVIGRAAAVAVLFRLRFRGYPAWLMWVFIHIMQLVEYENRVLVFVQWAFSYFTRNRGARLVTGDEPTGDGSAPTLTS